MVTIFQSGEISEKFPCNAAIPLPYRNLSRDLSDSISVENKYNFKKILFFSVNLIITQFDTKTGMKIRIDSTMYNIEVYFRVKIQPM